MSPAARHRTHPLSGAFTLIEIMAVMLLLALIAGVALPAFGRGSGAAAENDARELAAGIESGRRAALTHRVPFRLVVDLRNAAWWLEQEAHEEPEALRDLTPGELPAWAGLEVLPLLAPRAAARSYQPVPGLVGEGNVLRETVHFHGAETAEGWVEDGVVKIVLRPDGLADRTVLVLEAENGDRFHLEVEPLDETVGIEREAG